MDGDDDYDVGGACSQSETRACVCAQVASRVKLWFSQWIRVASRTCVRFPVSHIHARAQNTHTQRAQTHDHQQLASRNVFFLNILNGRRKNKRRERRKMKRLTTELVAVSQLRRWLCESNTAHRSRLSEAKTVCIMMYLIFLLFRFLFISLMKITTILIKEKTWARLESDDDDELSSVEARN